MNHAGRPSGQLYHRGDTGCVHLARVAEQKGHPEAAQRGQRIATRWPWRISSSRQTIEVSRISQQPQFETSYAPTEGRVLRRAICGF